LVKVDPYAGRAEKVRKAINWCGSSPLALEVMRCADNPSCWTALFLLFSSDRSEPAHAHVRRDERTVKVWLTTIGVARNDGFGPAVLNRILAVGPQASGVPERWLGQGRGYSCGWLRSPKPTVEGRFKAYQFAKQRIVARVRIAPLLAQKTVQLAVRLVMRRRCRWPQQTRSREAGPRDRDQTGVDRPAPSSDIR
jgi:hypothetical protein